MKVKPGRVEWIFLALLLVYIVQSFVPVPAFVALLLKSATAVFGAWVFLRIARGFVRQLLWRLRNRLIVAYIFIALVPVVLITLLIGLGVDLVGGQLTIYFITSEMERHSTALRNNLDALVRSDANRALWTSEVAPHLASENPGLVVSVRDAAGSRWKWPANASGPDLPENWNDGTGLVLLQNELYSWAQTSNGTRRVTAVVPVTREYLGLLAPDVCECTILGSESRRMLLHTSLAGDDSPSHNRFPPAVNLFDFEIRWGTPIPVHLDSAPDRIENQWLTVRTRPSALFRALFSQKMDIGGELIPVLFFAVAILFLVAEIISLVIGVSLTRTITATVHDLYQGTLRVRSSDFSHRIPIHGKDQLAELAVSFNQMTENMQRLLVVEKERERLQTELEIAREVQNQLYPRNVPEVHSLILTAACNPARMVSGDYYDYQQVGEQKVAIAIGDVAGKGISAALLMATVQSSFRSQLRACIDDNGHALSTSQLVDRLNKQLYADTAPEKYATFYLGLYDDANSTLTYTNAGHLPPILVRSGKAARLEVNGMVVGAFPFAHYAENKLELQPGDLVVFFTDGISEPENSYGEMFSEERLTDIIVKNAHLSEPQIVDYVMSSVREWTGSDELQDDMTLLLLRRR